MLVVNKTAKNDLLNGQKSIILDSDVQYSSTYLDHMYVQILTHSLQLYVTSLLMVKSHRF